MRFFLILLFCAAFFTTQGSAQKKSAKSIVKDTDGNVYHTVTIGKQVWMVENLKTTKYRNGDPIPNFSDNTAWGNQTAGAYCNYDNSPGNGTTYGRLYNWYAISDSRKIAPTGWHIPSNADWEILVDYLGGDDGAGGKLKETGFKHWKSPNTGTNENGFMALPGGYRSDFGAFYDIMKKGFWWSSTADPKGTAWSWRMFYSTSVVIKYDGSKKDGFSIRCVKD